MSRNALAWEAWGAEEALPDAGKIMEQNRLIKSKERVQKHGEVFTPPWMVEKMLAHEPIAAKVADIHATILEPSVGEGAFLVAILEKRRHEGGARGEHPPHVEPLPHLRRG